MDDLLHPGVGQVLTNLLKWVDQGYFLVFKGQTSKVTNISSMKWIEGVKILQMTNFSACIFFLTPYLFKIMFRSLFKTRGQPSVFATSGSSLV